MFNVFVITLVFSGFNVPGKNRREMSDEEPAQQRIGVTINRARSSKENKINKEQSHQQEPNFQQKRPPVHERLGPRQPTESVAKRFKPDNRDRYERSQGWEG